MEDNKRVIKDTGILYPGEVNLQKYSKKKEFHRDIVEKFAVERDWVYDFDFQDQGLTPESFGGRATMADLNKTMTYHDALYVDTQRLSNGHSLAFRIYQPKNPKKGQRGDAVLFHWLKGGPSCRVFVFPVYHPDTASEPADLFSGSFEKSYMDGLKYVYEKWEVYDDSYDIHDHDRNYYSCGFVYDSEEEILYYEDPYGYEDAAASDPSLT